MRTLADGIEGKYAKEGWTNCLTSDSANWRSLYLRFKKRAYCAEPLAVPALPNPAILLVINRSFRMEHYSEGRWRKIDYTGGTGMLTPRGMHVLSAPTLGLRGLSTCCIWFWPKTP